MPKCVGRRKDEEEQPSKAKREERRPCLTSTREKARKASGAEVSRRRETRSKQGQESDKRGVVSAMEDAEQA